MVGGPFQEVRAAVSHAKPAVLHNCLTGFYKQRLAWGQAGPPHALAKAAPALCKTQCPLNKSLQGLLSLCFKDVMERCLCAVTNCYLHMNLQWRVVPVAVVFRVQCQALHQRTVLLPMLLCASFLSAHSHVPHLLKKQSFLAFFHFHKLFSTLKKNLNLCITALIPFANCRC